MAELMVNKTTIYHYFKETGEKIYRIPPYQRPYAWEINEIDQLWEDVRQSFEDAPETEYFLGSIVTYQNGSFADIIDGQQRTITLLLFIRAILNHLNPKSKLFENVLPTIFKAKGLSGDIDEKKSPIIIASELIQEDNTILERILRRDYTEEEYENNQSRYFENFRRFNHFLDQYTTTNASQFTEFVEFLLKNCIILPIECNTFELSLRIFSTLNSRGLPLSELDIVKAELYERLNSNEERNEFVKDWGVFIEACEDGNISPELIFSIYNTYLMAKAGHRDAKKYGGALKGYFKRHSIDVFIQNNTLQNLIQIADIFAFLQDKSSNVYSPFEDYFIKSHIRLIMNAKTALNDNHVTPIIVYYLHYKDNLDVNRLRKFVLSWVQSILRLIFTKETTGKINALTIAKSIEIVNDSPQMYAISWQDEEESFIREQIKQLTNDTKSKNKRITTTILYILAILNPNQQEILANNLEIEHIIPRNGKNSTLFDKPWKEVQTYVERLGNKALFEKHLNIKASNYFYTRKKENYATSQVIDTKELSSKYYNEFTLDDVIGRELSIIDKLINYMKNKS